MRHSTFDELHSMMSEEGTGLIYHPQNSKHIEIELIAENTRLESIEVRFHGETILTAFPSHLILLRWPEQSKLRKIARKDTARVMNRYQSLAMIAYRKPDWTVETRAGRFAMSEKTVVDESGKISTLL